MALKGYFDGSGKSKRSPVSLRTLVGYAGLEDSWPVLETAWGTALEKHDAPTFQGSAGQSRHFHCREAFFDAIALGRRPGDSSDGPKLQGNVRTD
jgi:hypothetical protein